MKIICISGKGQHGKDTVATMIRKILEDDGERVLVTHYGDLLKYICKTFFGWDGEKDIYGRHLLQYVGTDVIRRQNPDYWVAFIASILKIFESEWDYVLIPDVRFPNEIDFLDDQDFDVFHLRVERKNFVSNLTPAQQKHISETALDHETPDYTIQNDGTLEDLQEKVSQFMSKMREYHQLTIEELLKEDESNE